MTPRTSSGSSGPVSATAGRKDEHLVIAGRDDVLHESGSGLGRVRLLHRALPGRDLAAVSLQSELLGRRLGAPLVISAMTGGTAAAAQVNHRLARAATEHRVALALGSGRALLDDPSLLPTYLGPDRPPLLIANIGAAQLVESGGLDAAERLTDLLAADALAVHLNPLQEAIQPEGETAFAGLTERIALLCARLAPLPVVVKEVGFGLAAADVGELLGAGVAAVDVAGSGGTNWALIEGQRGERAHRLAGAFADWGNPTALALRAAAARCAGQVELIGSGGIRDGVEAAKALALGADAAGLARPLLLAAQADRAAEALGELIAQLRIATWLTGAGSVRELSLDHIQEGVA